eukprot:02653_1
MGSTLLSHAIHLTLSFDTTNFSSPLFCKPVERFPKTELKMPLKSFKKFKKRFGLRCGLEIVSCIRHPTGEITLSEVKLQWLIWTGHYTCDIFQRKIDCILSIASTQWYPISCPLRSSN